MGTSGSYGGSSRQAWRNARQLLLDLPSGASGGGQDGKVPPEDLDYLEPLCTAIGDALAGDDPSIKNPVLDDDALSWDRLSPRVRPSRPPASGGASGGGFVSGKSQAAGRSGARSRRQVLRGAARGGAALGAAYAFRRGDAGALDDLGLDLDSLRSLGAVQRCGAILEAVLGEGGHPDEYALRKASLQSLKDVLLSDAPPDELDALRGFVVSYVYELALVELQSQLDAKSIDAHESARLERSIKHFLQRSVSHARIQSNGRLKSRDFQRTAAQLTKQAIQIIRAASEAA